MKNKDNIIELSNVERPTSNGLIMYYEGKEYPLKKDLHIAFIKRENLREFQIEEYNICVQYCASPYIGFDAWSDEIDVDLFYQIQQSYKNDDYYRKFTKGSYLPPESGKMSGANGVGLNDAKIDDKIYGECKEDKMMEEQEEWIKPERFDIPKDEYVVTGLCQDTEVLRIKLESERYAVEILFDGIPVMFQEAVEGMRMNTWGSVQERYGDRYYFRYVFFFEIKNSKLVKWCIKESCGFYNENELKHFCIVTSEEMIDVVSTFEPEVSITHIENKC